MSTTIPIRKLNLMLCGSALFGLFLGGILPQVTYSFSFIANRAPLNSQSTYSLICLPSSPLLPPQLQQNENFVSTTQLQSTSDENKMEETTNVRFLGKGDRAVIRPGVVLIAPNHEYNHYLMRSAVFLHGIGISEEGEHVTRGVIIDQPTAFTMGEMSGGSVYGSLGQNILFQGGDMGKDSAILLHSYGQQEELGTKSEEDCIECGEMIGTSGIYEGGLQAAMDLADDGQVDSEQFKFFFNYVEFTDQELKNMLGATDSEGDAWVSVEVPASIILESDYTRGEAWSYLRRQVRQMI